MERSFLVRGNSYISAALIFSLSCSPVLVTASQHPHCVLCEEEIPDEGADFELYEEFEKAFEEFDIEAVVEDDDESEAHKKGFLKKWCKNLKKWFTKKIHKIFRKMAGIKKMKNGEDCAYTIAKFKRKIDKKFYKSGTIDEMFGKFEEHKDSPAYADMCKFKDRVKFYHKNKHEKPPCHNPDKGAQDKAENDLKGIPVKAMIGGVGVVCGSIIMVIPFPGCANLGQRIVETGVTMIVYAYADAYVDEQKKQEEPNK